MPQFHSSPVYPGTTSTKRETDMNNAQFSIAFRLGARKARRQNKITREEFQLVVSILRDPVRDTTEYGAVNILSAVQDFVTAQLVTETLDDEPGVLPTLSILALITFIIENMDAIMAFIQQIINLFSNIGEVEPV